MLSSFCQAFGWVCRGTLRPAKGEAASGSWIGMPSAHCISGFSFIERGTVGRIYPKPAASYPTAAPSSRCNNREGASRSLQPGSRVSNLVSDVAFPVRFRHTSERVLLVEGLCWSISVTVHGDCHPAPVRLHQIISVRPDDASQRRRGRFKLCHSAASIEYPVPISAASKSCMIVSTQPGAT